MKRLNPWIDPRVVRVTVAEMRNYLLNHGWRPRSSPRPQLLDFEGPMAEDGEPLVVAFPASEGSDDYPQRVSEVLVTLATLEDRWVVDVLNDVLRGPPTNGAAQHVAQSEPAEK